VVHPREPLAEPIAQRRRGAALSVATPVSVASTVAVALTAVVVGDSAQAVLSDEATLA
jgi:hypothetical protein